jgi:hypothetical protein
LDFGFSASGWRDFGDLMIGHPGLASQNVAEVGVGMDVSAAAAFDDRVEDGSTVSSSGSANEDSVLLADGRWAECVFHQVVIDLHPVVSHIHLQCLPLAEGIVDGDTQ